MVNHIFGAVATQLLATLATADPASTRMLNSAATAFTTANDANSALTASFRIALANLHFGTDRTADGMATRAHTTNASSAAPIQVPCDGLDYVHGADTASDDLGTASAAALACLGVEHLAAFAVGQAYIADVVIVGVAVPGAQALSTDETSFGARDKNAGNSSSAVAFAFGELVCDFDNTAFSLAAITGCLVLSTTATGANMVSDVTPALAMTHAVSVVTGDLGARFARASTNVYVRLATAYADQRASGMAPAMETTNATLGECTDGPGFSATVSGAPVLFRATPALATPSDGSSDTVFVEVSLLEGESEFASSFAQIALATMLLFPVWAMSTGYGALVLSTIAVASMEISPEVGDMNDAYLGPWMATSFDHL